MKATGAKASVLLVGAFDLLAAMEDAIAAGIRYLVTPTEGMPVHDALKAWRRCRETGTVWVGASTPGMAVAGEAKLGFLPDDSLRPGAELPRHGFDRRPNHIGDRPPPAGVDRGHGGHQRISEDDRQAISVERHHRHTRRRGDHRVSLAERAAPKRPSVTAPIDSDPDHAVAVDLVNRRDH